MASFVQLYRTMEHLLQIYQDVHSNLVTYLLENEPIIAALYTGDLRHTLPESSCNLFILLIIITMSKATQEEKLNQRLNELKTLLKNKQETQKEFKQKYKIDFDVLLDPEHPNFQQTYSFEDPK